MTTCGMDISGTEQITADWILRALFLDSWCTGAVAQLSGAPGSYLPRTLGGRDTGAARGILHSLGGTMVASWVFIRMLFIYRMG